jgi:hypothetical protein
MFADFKELLSAFNAHNVKYLVVGGYAVSLHGQPRATKDLDLFIKADAANAAAVYAALASFGAPLVSITVEDFFDARKFIRFGKEPVAVDILPSIDGVDFDEAWAKRVSQIIDPDRGLVAFFISRDDLIASKLATGRLRDLADAQDLRAAADASRPKQEADESSNAKDDDSGSN